MTPTTIANIEATRDLIDLAGKRIDQHEEDFAKVEALDALSTARRLLADASRILKQAPTIEDHAAVMRMSLQLVRDKKNGAQAGADS